MDARRTLEVARVASPSAEEVGAALSVLVALAPTCDGWIVEAMRLFYVDRRTWREVGEKLGYSAVHVRRTVHKALAASVADSANANQRGNQT